MEIISALGSILDLISTHHLGDIVYWALFFLGQCIWVLICCAAAIRSTHNPIKSRRAYIKANWDIFLIRFIAEWILIYYPYRHYSLNDVLTFFHVGYQLPISMGNSPIATIALGTGSDVILNTFAKWQGAPSWLQPVQAFILERIPQVPMEQVAIVKTTTVITPTADDAPVITKTTTAPVMGPTQEKPR
jgi:hypothetical protein